MLSRCELYWILQLCINEVTKMKNSKFKLLGIVTILACLVFFGGTVSSTIPLPALTEHIGQANPSPNINRDKVIEIAEGKVPVGADLREVDLKRNNKWALDIWSMKFVENGDIFRVDVDATSGKVVQFRKSEETSGYDGNAISMEEGLSLAQNNVGIPQQYRLEASTKKSEDRYKYVWQRYKSGVKIVPDQIVVRVNPYTQEITSYKVIIHEKLPDTKPEIAETTAVNVAKKYLKNQGIEISQGDIYSESQVDSSIEGELKLMWTVKFIDNKYHEGHWIGVWIDANTGKFLRFDECL